MTHLDDRMLLDDLDATPQNADTILHDTVSLPRRILARIPELEGMRARIANELFGVTLPPARIGRFRLQAKIGEGGMGQVYAAHDDTLDRRVAVKVLHAERLATRDGRARMLREAQALARLSHPNVVQVFEVGEHDNQIYVAMELIAGQDLAHWLTAAPRSWRAVLAVFLAAGQGLQAAHEAGLVHRDFKPANVIVGDDGRVRVLDFGLARAAHTVSEGTRADSQILNSQLTMTGAIHGTPVYLAPELLRDHRADARADQYAFCVALYEGLYGARPHRADNLATLTAAKLRGEIEAPPTDIKIPAWLHAAVLRGLAVEPNERWPSMRVLLAELARDRVTARRRKLSLALGGVLLATAGVAGVQAMRADAAAELAAATARLELARAETAEAAAAASAREHAAVLRVRASEAAIRRANDLAASPARVREAITLAAAALHGTQATGAPTTPALRALVTALGAPRLARDLTTPDEIRDLRLAADEQVLVTRGDDWTLRLWDLATGAELAALPRIHAVRVDPRGRLLTLGEQGLDLRDPHTGAVLTAIGPGEDPFEPLPNDRLLRRDPNTRAVVMSLGKGEDTLELAPDGRLAAVRRPGGVDIHDLERATLLTRIPGVPDQLAFSADNHRLVTTRDGAATLWSLPDGRNLGRMPTTISRPHAQTRAAISPDGQRVAVTAYDADHDHDLWIWDTHERPRLISRSIGHTQYPFALQFSADGRSLLSAGMNGLLFLWNSDDGRMRQRIDVGTDWIADVALSPDGQRIVAADSRGVLRSWDAHTGEPQLRVVSEHGEVDTLRLSADGKRLFSASKSGHASAWTFPAGVPPTLAIPGPVLAADLHPASDRVALLAPDGSVQLQTLGPDPRPLTLASIDPARKHLRLAPDAATLLTTTEDGNATLWDATTGQPRCSLTGLSKDPHDLAHAANHTLLGITADDHVRVWSTEDCRELATPLTFKYATLAGWLVPAPTGQSLVARNTTIDFAYGPPGTGVSGTTTHLPVHTLLDPTGTTAPVHLDLGDAPSNNAAFSPDGAQIAIVGRNGLARVHDTRTGALLGQLPDQDGWISHARYAPDGATLLTLGGGHTAHLWRTSDRSLLARLEIGETPTRAAFSADGARILIADERGQVGLWDALTHEFAGTLARLEGPPLRVAFSADDADALLIGPVHGALRVPATAAGILAASQPLLAAE